MLRIQEVRESLVLNKSLVINPATNCNNKINQKLQTTKKRY